MGRKKADDEPGRTRNEFTLKADEYYRKAQTTGDRRSIRICAAYLTRAMMTDEDLNAFFDIGFYNDLIRSYCSIAADRAGLNRADRERMDRELKWSLEHYRAEKISEEISLRLRGSKQ